MEFLRWIFFLPAAWVAQFIVKWFFTSFQLLIGPSLILDLFGDHYGWWVITILMSVQVLLGAFAFTFVGMFVAPRRPRKTFLLALIPCLPFISSVVIYTTLLWNYLPFDLWQIEQYRPFTTQTYLTIFTGYIPALLSIWFYKPLRSVLLNARR